MGKADTLIRTKLRPPLIRQGVIPRPRLQAQIAQGMHGSLTLITAPAVLVECTEGGIGNHWRFIQIRLKYREG
jgi:hypothetical protein